MSELSRYQDTAIGPYRLTHLIGVGPVSRVYLGERQDWPGREVVLKLFETVPLHDLEEKGQTLDEVRLLTCLEHPALLPILDNGLHEDMLYLVTPYLKAGSLRQRLTSAAGNPLPVAGALALVRQIGEALQFAHAQQIVHANIKPENILFRENGNVLLADFLLPGLVKSERAARILSSFAALYMAPEQFRGVATPLSDQYALACLTYELLTGQPPFVADDGMSLARQHATREPVLPSRLQPLCSPQLDRVLLKALVKRPEGRHADIQTFLAELHAPAEGVVPLAPVQVEPTAPPTASIVTPARPQEVEPQVSSQAIPEQPEIFDLETTKQPVLQGISLAMNGIHEAVRIARRGVQARSQAGIQRQFVPISTLQEPVPLRARPGARLTQRQVWLTAVATLLILVLSISGLALLFNTALAHQHTPQVNTRATTTPPMPTATTGQALPVTAATATVTATATPSATATAALPTPTATATPGKKPTATPTATATPTPTPTPTPVSLQCQVIYTVFTQRAGDFIANLKITNTGMTVIQNWTLVFTFPSKQQIFSGSNGNFTQNGAQVSITNVSANGTLRPGDSANPGFQAISHGANKAPNAFSLNGIPCQVGTH